MLSSDVWVGFYLSCVAELTQPQGAWHRALKDVVGLHGRMCRGEGLVGWFFFNDAGFPGIKTGGWLVGWLVGWFVG